ncbi:substrate-binding domain-containing protein [Clostridium vitabionis]|uniref:substrate-binding domain-containing protein n=1 Tax=Clostridium vitabionis TaxID=2784388 RepID=UPI00188DB7E9|nr:substrate-binding domain-containing protein [Clostridium vitabionis]
MPIRPLIPCLEAFTSQNPDITFSIFDIVNMKQIQPEQFDALLYYAQSNTLNMGEGELIGTTQGVYVLPASTPLKSKNELTLKDLISEPQVSLLWGDSKVEEIFDDYRHMGMVPNIRYRTNSSAIKKEIMAAGLAVGSSNLMVIADLKNTLSSAMIPKATVYIQTSNWISCYIGWRKSEFLSPAALAFKKFTHQWLRDHPDQKY